MIETFFGHREANQSTSALGHEVDGFGSDFLRGQSEVAFVLAILVVHDHNHAAVADFLDGGLNICKWRVRTHLRRL